MERDHFIKNFFVLEFAIRECLPDGTWKPNVEETNSSTVGWTNYTRCLSTNHKPQLPIDKHVRILTIKTFIYSNNDHCFLFETF
jgi:hypothetical protein